MNYTYFNESSIRDIQAFYNNFRELNFKTITIQRIIELKDFAINLNRDIDYKYGNLSKFERYVKTINTIRTNPKKYNLNNFTEKAIMFMLAIDPCFEATILLGESNTIKEAKSKLNNRFGIYDGYLIKIERAYIKTFLEEKEKKEINDEIERRVFS